MADAVKERPILMSAPMVLAILEGRKTQTRRVVKQFDPSDARLFPKEHSERPGEWIAYSGGQKGKPDYYRLRNDIAPVHCPYGKPGDRLWVREAWRGAWHVGESTNFHLMYPADGSEAMKYVDEEYVLPKAAAKPDNIVTPLFMPRWASRITLEITDVRVQRLQDISEWDAIEEGTGVWLETNQRPSRDGNPDEYRKAYRSLWDSINGKKHPWDSNPWVWVVTFEVVR